MIKGEEYVPESTDVWSLGITLYAMTFAKLPFEDESTSALYESIKKGSYSIDKPISPALRDLLSKMINTEPKKRISLKDIYKHEWFSQKAHKTGLGIRLGYDSVPIDEDVINQIIN